MKDKHLVVWLLMLGLLMGCSGMKVYHDTAAKNLQITTVTDSGSILSKVRASLDIYAVGGDCNTEYEGTVKLGRDPVAVGIPSGRLSYLVFEFTHSDFLQNSSGTISYDVLLRPCEGCKYDVDVSYKEDIYNVVFRERHPNEKQGREIELRDLSSCSQ